MNNENNYGSPSEQIQPQYNPQEQIQPQYNPQMYNNVPPPPQYNPQMYNNVPPSPQYGYMPPSPYMQQPGYMQPMTGLQSAAKVAFKWGGIFGAIQIGVNLLWQFVQTPLIFNPLLLQNHLPIATLILYENIFSYSIVALIFFLAAMQTAKQTATIGAGLIACLWTLLWGEISGILLFWISVVLMTPEVRVYLLNGSYILSSYLPSLFWELLISGAILLVFGALGSLVGRNMARGSLPR